MFQFNGKNPQTPSKSHLQQQMCHNCDTSIHLLRYCIHGSVQLCHFVLPVSICCVLSSVPAWTVRSWHQTATEDQDCPAIWYFRFTLHSDKLANTKWWKGLCSRDFQNSDTKMVEVGTELRTEYNVIFIEDIFT
jgi:hypothetical protein